MAPGYQVYVEAPSTAKLTVDPEHKVDEEVLRLMVGELFTVAVTAERVEVQPAKLAST